MFLTFKIIKIKLLNVVCLKVPTFQIKLREFSKSFNNKRVIEQLSTLLKQQHNVFSRPFCSSLPTLPSMLLSFLREQGNDKWQCKIH